MDPLYVTLASILVLTFGGLTIQIYSLKKRYKKGQIKRKEER